MICWTSFMSRLRRGYPHIGCCMFPTTTSLVICLKSLLRLWTLSKLPLLCWKSSTRLRLPSLTASRSNSSSMRKKRTQNLLRSRPRGGPKLQSVRLGAQLHLPWWSCSPLFWLKWRRTQGRSLATSWRRDPSFACSTTRLWLRRSSYATGNGWRGRK